MIGLERVGRQEWHVAWGADDGEALAALHTLRWRPLSPFQRARHGLGLTLLHSGDGAMAEVRFRWGLRLNCDDQIGLRFLVTDRVAGCGPLRKQ